MNAEKTNGKLELNDKVTQKSELHVKDAAGKEVCTLLQLPDHPQKLFFMRARESEVYKVGYTIGYDPGQPDRKWFTFMYREVEKRKSVQIPVEQCEIIVSEVRDHLRNSGYEVWEDS